MSKVSFREGSISDEVPRPELPSGTQPQIFANEILHANTKPSPIQSVVSFRFSHVPTYIWATLFSSLAGFLFGFDTGSIGPVTVMPRFKEKFNDPSPLLHGLIVSSILIPASLASLVAGPISDKISRKKTFAIGGAIFAAGSTVECAANSLMMLFIGRCIAGMGEGLFLSTLTVYVCEIAPTAIRGTLSCTIQLYITIGVTAGYFVSFGTVQTQSSLSWRFIFGMQAVVSTIFAVGSILLPHSPRWLQHVGRHADATAAWKRLGFTDAEAEKEQETVLRADHEAERVVEPWYKVAGAVFHKDVRKRTLLGCFIMAMQQACGIDGVLYYAPVLFSQAGLSSSRAAFLASGVSGLLTVFCTIITQIYTERWGRRSSMIRGGILISGSMLLIGALYASNATNTVGGRYSVIALIYLFIGAFSCSWAVVNRLYCTEIQPTKTRAAATSLGQCANWIVNWIIAFTTPLFLSKSSSGAYFLFGACSALTVLVCLVYAPESRGVSVDGLDALFEVSPWRKTLMKRGVKRGQNIELSAM